jgi:pimeloyl-ACP methyl ester carboxylesterase
VLYFHGYAGSRLEARAGSAAARGTGLRLLGVDRPGFGESTFQAERSIGAWPADIAALADGLGLRRFSIVGVSGGAPYALACAAALAERLNHVALVCPLGPLDAANSTAGMLPQDRLMLALAARTPRIARLTIRLLASWIRRRRNGYLEFLTTGLAPPDRDVIAEPSYCSLMLESTMEALRQGGRGAAWELTLLARPWDFRLAEVRMRVSLWQGLADQIVPVPMARRLEGVLPACKSHYIPGEGHLSLVARRIGEVLAQLRPAASAMPSG